MMSARFHAAAMYPGAISWRPSAASENARVTEDRWRDEPPARPSVSTATTSTWCPRFAAPSARLWTTRSMPPERGQ